MSPIPGGGRFSFLQTNRGCGVRYTAPSRKERAEHELLLRPSRQWKIQEGFKKGGKSAEERKRMRGRLVPSGYARGLQLPLLPMVGRLCRAPGLPQSVTAAETLPRILVKNLQDGGVKSNEKARPVDDSTGRAMLFNEVGVANGRRRSNARALAETPACPDCL